MSLVLLLRPLAAEVSQAMVAPDGRRTVVEVGEGVAMCFMRITDWGPRCFRHRRRPHWLWHRRSLSSLHRFSCTPHTQVVSLRLLWAVLAHMCGRQRRAQQWRVGLRIRLLTG